MRVLTVRQPWAWAIIHGGKSVENRGRAFSYRGMVAIHAGLADAPDAPDSLWLAAMADRESTVLREPGKSLARWQPRGVVIGVVDLIDAHKAVPLDRLDGSVGCCCEPWGQPGQVHHVLANPVALPEPFEVRGRLGLTRFASELDERFVLAQLRQVA